MHPVYGNKCSAKQTVHIWCKNAGWAEICIIYRGAIGRSSVARTATRIVLCIGHSEVCWQRGQIFKWTRTMCRKV